MSDALYKDPSRGAAQPVADLIARMTVEEQVGQMCQVHGGKPGAEEWVTEKNIGSFLHVIGEGAARLQALALRTRLGIPLIFGIDAIHGHALHGGATIFPTQLALASSWNASLVEEVARVTAREMAATGMHWTFSPVLCIARDLRWGRVDETFGEDVYLIGELASAMVRGYQGRGLAEPESVLACAKHYAGYSQTEGGRDASEAYHSERAMRATFLPAFEAAARAGCATFMAAYQAIDGTPCSDNRRLLHDVLRGEWGFDGVVVTDWNNVGFMVTAQFVAEDLKDASRRALEAGNDMIMSTPGFYEAAIELAREGAVDARLIDDACRRILRLKFELGLFDGKAAAGASAAREVIACREHRDAALEAAYQSIVLLKNCNAILPLAPDVSRIAVIGPNADDVSAQLGDWVDHAEQPRENIVTVLDGIRRRACGECEVEYARGADAEQPTTEFIGDALKLARDADVAVVVLGDTRAQHGEWHDRADLALSSGQQQLVETLHETGVPIVAVLINSKPLSIGWLAEHAAAILEAWNPGMEGGTAIAGLLFGDRNPSGKLAISFPRHVGQQPVHYSQPPGWHGTHYIDLAAGPLYAFGYGLSYTTWEYSNLRIARDTLIPGEPLVVEVDVANTGSVDGVEIAQLYVNDVVSSVTTPARELKAFARVKLSAGQSRTVRFEVPFERLSLVNRDCRRVVEPGEFEVMAGASSRDEDLLKARFRVASSEPAAV